MPVEKYPNVGGYSEGEEIVWTPNTDDVQTLSWDGCRDDVYNVFLARRAAAPGTADVFELAYRSAAGKATLIERRMRADGNVVEEILGIDVMKDVLTHEYFASLSNDEITAVTKAFQLKRAEGETDGPPSGGFTGLQGELYFQLIHGVETYPETAWIFSKATRAVKYKTVAASYAGVNEVDIVGPAVEASSIQKLITAIPTGEWLKKPPRTPHVGKGKYDVYQEWWWAKKWPKFLGGTFGLPDA